LAVTTTAKNVTIGCKISRTFITRFRTTGTAAHAHHVDQPMCRLGMAA
jgi:hypothetical protein